uniref:DZANK-type domain-containing protein n=2 Tax=Metallosphaera hakonensis TaxID=79601 RepID=A0A2U9IRF0_9CREN
MQGTINRADLKEAVGLLGSALESLLRLWGEKDLSFFVPYAYTKTLDYMAWVQECSGDSENVQTEISELSKWLESLVRQAEAGGTTQPSLLATGGQAILGLAYLSLHRQNDKMKAEETLNRGINLIKDKVDNWLKKDVKYIGEAVDLTKNLLTISRLYLEKGKLQTEDKVKAASYFRTLLEYYAHIPLLTEKLGMLAPMEYGFELRLGISVLKYHQDISPLGKLRAVDYWLFSAPDSSALDELELMKGTRKQTQVSWDVALISALGARDNEHVLNALKNGADPNRIFMVDTNPLVVAIVKDYKWGLEQLLANGANPYAKLSTGHSAMDVAKMYGKGYAVELMIKYAGREILSEVNLTQQSKVQPSGQARWYKCPHCGGIVRDITLPCPDCGSSLAGYKPCPSCGGLNPPGTKFCGFCGKPT